MSGLPFYIVTLTHATWDAARSYGCSLPEDALPELRLDLFPDEDAAAMVRDLSGRCLVTNRRGSEGGQATHETTRVDRLRAAVEGGAAWVDLEWELPIPTWLNRSRTQLLRSVHVEPGVFDLEQRLQQLPQGDAFKWVGHASRLADNAKVKPSLARGLPLSAFLLGPKGIPSRCMQRAWGGAFTYGAPDGEVGAAPGQIHLHTMRSWGCEGLSVGAALTGVLGSPVLHSLGPAFHTPRLGGKALYLPLECSDAEEAAEALDALDLPCASITAPLKATLPGRLGLMGPLNTIWRDGGTWRGANTDEVALRECLSTKPRGTVLILGAGGVAQASGTALEALHFKVIQASRSQPLEARIVVQEAPVGVIQATTLGMSPGDPLPFPQLLDAARGSALWAVEWVYKERTAFANWAEGLDLVDGASLFRAQAEAQSRIFQTVIR